MINVLHILNTDKLSGAEKVVLLLAKNYSNDIKMNVLCKDYPLAKVYEDIDINTYTFGEGKSILKIADDIRKIVVENNIHIIHAHDNMASIYSLITKKRYKLKDIKIISHIHSSYQWLLNFNKFKVIDKLTRNSYDYNIVCGDMILDFYKQNANYIDSSKFLSIPNGIDVNEISSISSIDDELKSKLNIPKDKLVFGYIGRLIELKGLIPFIKKLSSRKNELDNVVFLIVGSGEQEQEIKNLVKEEYLDGMFIFTGFYDKVYNVYPLIDCLLLPSVYEGLPMVILEAMAFAKPIISMDVGSISDVVNKNTGFLIKAGNYDEFVDKVIYASKNREMLPDIGQNSLKFIKENYDIRNKAKEIEILYNNLYV